MMDLKNKRVLVVGLGKSGLSAAMFLREQGARVTVSDTRSAVALAKEIPALLEAGIMVESGGHGLLTFRRQDLIVVSPGVPMDTPEVKQVVAFGLPVIGELITVFGGQSLENTHFRGGEVLIVFGERRLDLDVDGGSALASRPFSIADRRFHGWGRCDLSVGAVTGPGGKQSRAIAHRVQH